MFQVMTLKVASGMFVVVQPRRKRRRYLCALCASVVKKKFTTEAPRARRETITACAP
jgi:hypothetical protein